MFSSSKRFRYTWCKRREVIVTLRITSLSAISVWKPEELAMFVAQWCLNTLCKCALLDHVYISLLVFVSFDFWTQQLIRAAYNLFQQNQEKRRSQLNILWIRFGFSFLLHNWMSSNGRAVFTSRGLTMVQIGVLGVCLTCGLPMWRQTSFVGAKAQLVSWFCASQMSFVTPQKTFASKIWSSTMFFSLKQIHFVHLK